MLEKVNKSFKLSGRNMRVVEDVSLRVEAGEAVALLGPSGCGKSTLLGLVAGFYPPDSGQVHTEGRIGMMMQDDMLLPWRDVLSNVCLPVEIRDKKSLPRAREQANELLPLFGLDGFGASLPSQLSGGMRQRAALLRTVMGEGDFWLLDEPFARLDALTKEELQEWLIEIRERFSSGMLLVTHDMDEALLLCNRIYLMSARPGRIIEEMPVKEKAPAYMAQQKMEMKRILRSGNSSKI